MTDNILKIRIKHRIDTTANWENCADPPLNGELIIYKAEQGASAQFKIGDGINTASNLPFITEGLATENYVIEQIQTSITDMLTREEMEAYVNETILGGAW